MQTVRLFYLTACKTKMWPLVVQQMGRTTPGQYLARAGRSYNLAIGLAFAFGLITPLLAPAVGSVGTIALSGVGVLSVLIANFSGNSNLIQAGKGLDKETDASKP